MHGTGAFLRDYKQAMGKEQVGSMTDNQLRATEHAALQNLNHLRSVCPPVSTMEQHRPVRRYALLALLCWLLIDISCSNLAQDALVSIDHGHWLYFDALAFGARVALN